MAIPTNPIQNVDPFARAIPGQSLTEQPGLRPYEKPPTITTPGQLLRTIEPVLKREEVAENIADLLEVGISCESIADGFCKKYFTEGAATPDVVELAKPGLFIIVAQIGKDHDVEDMKLFNKDPDSSGEGKLATIDKLRMMSKIHPKKYQKIEDRLNKKDEEEGDGVWETESESFDGEIENEEEFAKILKEVELDRDNEVPESDTAFGSEEDIYNREYGGAEGSFLDRRRDDEEEEEEGEIV
jgi:hypothetical protein